MTSKIIITIDALIFAIIGYLVMPRLVPFLTEFLLGLILIPLAWLIFRKIHNLYLSEQETEKISIRFFEGLFALLLIYEVSVTNTPVILFNWADYPKNLVASIVIIYGVLFASLSYLIIRHKNILSLSIFKFSNLIWLIAFILFWSPWMLEDGGEDIIRKIQAREIVTKDSQEQLVIQNNPNCDGVSVSWVPFGIKTECMSRGDKYVTFWGQEFDL
ncbi:MAG: hypothetical protein RLZZ230_405 [Candidatus Parcubacteria bacterium]|jgi:hypothetical protein